MRGWSEFTKLDEFEGASIGMGEICSRSDSKHCFENIERLAKEGEAGARSKDITLRRDGS